MLILEPTIGQYTINIIPRIIDVSGTISLTIRRDGDGVEESTPPLNVINAGNYIQIYFSSSILTEDSTYYLEITKDDSLWYRDKIYVTSQSSQDMLLNSHKIGNGSLYKPYNELDDNTYIIKESSVPNDDDDDVVNPPIVDVPFILFNTSSENFIQLDFPYFEQINATNNPTSYSVDNLIDGLSLDSVTGIITGTVTGEPRTASMTLKASNEIGEGIKQRSYTLTNESADDFLAPYNLYATNSTVDGFLLAYSLRDYNRTITEVEVFRNNVLFKTLIIEPYVSYSSVVLTGINGTFDYKVRLKNSLGEYSPFSEIFTHSVYQVGVMTPNESNNKVSPTLNDAIAYYKFEETDLTTLVDELGNNNGTYQGGYSSENNYLGLIGRAGTFDERLLASAVVPNDPSFYFGETTGSEKPFSISIWFKIEDDTAKGTRSLISKSLGGVFEWKLSYTDGSTPINGLTPNFEMSFRDSVNNSIMSHFMGRGYGFSQFEINAGEWNHFVYSYNGRGANERNTFLWYLNNSYMASTDTPPSLSSNNGYERMIDGGGGLVVGGERLLSPLQSKTSIDELLIFNRELTKDEVNFLYNNGLANTL
tara:strand:+ start:60 stop:1835 length:1776 start_codon:yes stop_codon:yes gene_type:complete